MADVYQRDGIGFNGAMAADAAKLTFKGLGNDGVGMLAQNINLSYTQQITKIYELGSNNVFYIAGRTQGQVQMARIVGQGSVQRQFYENYGNVCRVDQNNFVLSVSQNCPGSSFTGPTQPSNFDVKQAVINSIGISIQSQDMVVNESVQMIFGSLELN